MSTDVRKVLMPFCCIAILGAMVYYYLVSVPGGIPLWVVLICGIAPEIIFFGGTSAKYRKPFCVRIKFYWVVFVLAVVAIIAVNLLKWVFPSLNRVDFWHYALGISFVNTVLYTIELYRPGLLPLKEENPQTDETE